MPTVGSEPAGESEKAARASMTSLPAFAYAVASGKTKNGAPLPTRFCTEMFFDVAVGIAAKPLASAVSFMTLGATVVHRPAWTTTSAQVLADVLLTVPYSTPLT